MQGALTLNGGLVASLSHLGGGAMLGNVVVRDAWMMMIISKLQDATKTE